MWLKTKLPGASSQEADMFPREALRSRASETAAILKSLSAGDPSVDPSFLTARIKEAFIEMQNAWQANDYSGMTGRMMPRLQAGHSLKVEAMRARGEINMMEDVTVHSVDFVHVRFPSDPANRSITALITASARDYTISSSDRSVISGSREPRTFQEFWTFELLNGNWVPGRIDQTSEEGILSAPNLPAAPESAARAAATAAPVAPAAPFIPPGASSIPSPFDMPLAAPPPASFAASFPTSFGMPVAAAAISLSVDLPPPPPRPAEKKIADFATPGPWNKQKMEIAATLAFLSVYSAWEKGDPPQLQNDQMFPETLQKLSTLIDARRAEGLAFEFSGLYARKAEVVLTAEASKSRLGMDEFTARITAIARRTLLRDGKTLSRDDAPEPFTEYWVFARTAEGNWKFKDILLRADSEPREGTLDNAPTPVQIEWYW